MLKRFYAKKMLSIILMCAMMLPMHVAARVENIADGKAKTVTITMNERFSIMQTTDGVNLNGYASGLYREPQYRNNGGKVCF